MDIKSSGIDMKAWTYAAATEIADGLAKLKHPMEKERT